MHTQNATLDCTDYLSAQAVAKNAAPEPSDDPFEERDTVPCTYVIGHRTIVSRYRKPMFMVTLWRFDDTVSDGDMIFMCSKSNLSEALDEAEANAQLDYWSSFNMPTVPMITVYEQASAA